MATAAQKIAAENQAPGPLYYLDDHEAQIKTALPKHMDIDRFRRMVLTEYRLNKKVQAAARRNPLSFFGACIQAAQLGLEPGSALGHVYFVPIETKDNGTVVATEIALWLGYKGMLELASRSGRLDYIISSPVLYSDRFRSYVRTPEGAYLYHEPNLELWLPTEETTRLVFALAKLKGCTGAIPEIMTKAQLNAHEQENRKGRYRSKAWDNKYTWVQMARKTCIRRLFNYLPKSSEMMMAMALEDKGGMGMAQHAREMGLEKIPEDVQSGPDLTANAGKPDQEHPIGQEFADDGEYSELEIELIEEPVDVEEVPARASKKAARS